MEKKQKNKRKILHVRYKIVNGKFTVPSPCSIFVIRLITSHVNACAFCGKHVNCGFSIVFQRKISLFSECWRTNYEFSRYFSANRVKTWFLVLTIHWFISMISAAISIFDEMQSHQNSLDIRTVESKVSYDFFFS